LLVVAVLVLTEMRPLLLDLPSIMLAAVVVDSTTLEVRLALEV
jgi:hypothetical protein